MSYSGMGIAAGMSTKLARIAAASRGDSSSGEGSELNVGVCSGVGEGNVI